MSLQRLLDIVTDKENFRSLGDYIVFCQKYLEFIDQGLQAVIVSQNEPNYRFFQYRKDGHYSITRPINSELMYNAAGGNIISRKFPKILRNAMEVPIDDEKSRAIIRNAIYTIQQTIGAALDALPVGKSNVARKINGDLFERLIRLLLQELRVDCRSQVIKIPVMVDGIEQFRMNYQHDLLFFKEENLKIIGSVKPQAKIVSTRFSWINFYIAA